MRFILPDDDTSVSRYLIEYIKSVKFDYMSSLTYV